MAKSSVFDCVIIGAGAAGMMCGAFAGQKGESSARRKSVLILDHAKTVGEKIRISGGGRCNFTNRRSAPKHFLSSNPKFCRSALARYTPQDFIALVDRYKIKWHEKTLGQLFCDEKSQQIIDMLRAECARAGNEIWLQTDIKTVKKTKDGFALSTSKGAVLCRELVIACGGASIPKMGASRFGYKLAAAFGLNVIEPRPGLVPLTFTDALKAPLKTLSGISVDARVSRAKTSFDEALLFTHRGLSGPSILQISSYWQAGQDVHINLLPNDDMSAALKAGRAANPKQSPVNFLSGFLPARLAQFITAPIAATRLADMTSADMNTIIKGANTWAVRPAGTEGFRTAEVTLGGVDTKCLSSKSMAAHDTPGLYFIGEVVDVTGHLGGHNFQWAWASAAAAGRAIAAC